MFPALHGVLSQSVSSPILLANLVSFWELEEASGSRADAHGSNNLADNNTVTQAVGKVGNAAQFTAANLEHLSIADNASLSMGDIDFTIAAWVYLDTKNNFGLVSKWLTSGNQRGYLLLYSVSDGGVANRFGLLVSANGATPTARVNANNFGEPSTGAWCFVVAWHDATTNTINIQVNNGTVDSTAHTTGVFDNTASFSLGGILTTYEFNGRLDQVMVAKEVYSATVRTWLYNSGNGRSYAEVATYTG